jgi:phosphohistidine phosphatase
MQLLIVVRHAKAESAHLHAVDYDRPLAKQGIEDAERIAGDLVKRHPEVTAIVASPARRTARTAEIIASAYGWSAERIEWDERIYEASVDTLRDIVRELDTLDGIVVLVGHNPGVLELCYGLTNGTITKMSPGAVVEISRTADRK